jgi:hypothetical protein
VPSLDLLCDPHGSIYPSTRSTLDSLDGGTLSIKVVVGVRRGRDGRGSGGGGDLYRQGRRNRDVERENA